MTLKDSTGAEERLIGIEQSPTATCVSLVSWANSTKVYFVSQNVNACTQEQRI